jgi:uncharacterized protein YndB with AHSA1/START domain
MILHDEILIQAPPATVFAFFENMEQNYTRWHPNHILFRWTKGDSLAEGSESYFEERIGHQLIKREVVYTRIVPNHYIEFALTTWLFRLFMPRLFFEMRPEGEGTRFIAEIHLRLGPISKWLNRKDLEDVRQHMKEEGENLKQLMENPTTASSKEGDTHAI